MKKNWIKIFSSNNHIEITIISQMLVENNFFPVILNRQDSSYKMFGAIDLYITEEDQEKAIELLKQHNNERNA